MSFEHRFGLGIGGSREDPFIPPCCDDCNEECLTGECERLFQYQLYMEEITPIQEPPTEDE